MNKQEVSPSAKIVWLASLVCLVILLVGFGFLTPNFYVPPGVEIILKTIAVVAFLFVVFIPVFYLVMTLRAQKRSKALVAAAVVTVVGYTALFAQLVYVKVKGCNSEAIPYDERWHCNVEGKAVAASIILIPLLAAAIGLLVGALERIRGKRR